MTCRSEKVKTVIGILLGLIGAGIHIFALIIHMIHLFG